MRQRILYILIFSTCFNTVSFTQNIWETISFADSLYKYGNYNFALKEYQRAIFFSEKISNTSLYEKAGDCFFKLKDYQKANEFYDYAYFNYKTDSLKYEALFKKVKSYLTNKEFQYALIELYSLSDSLPTSILQEREFYLGIGYFGLGDYNLAKQSFLNCIDPIFQGQLVEIENIFNNNKKLYKPKPFTAYIFSLIIPGMGQVYSGDIKSGFNSLILNSGLFVLVMVVGNKFSIIDGVISVLPGFKDIILEVHYRLKKLLKLKETKIEMLYIRIL